MSSVRMVLGAVVNNPLPSTPSWKGLGNRSPGLLAPQPLQLMLKTGLLTLRSCSRFWGCADEFKARLASYKLEGDALSWWKAVKQAKGGETYVATLPWKVFRELFFLQYFPRLAGFVVADAARNIEILRERSSQNNKRNRDGDRIRPIAQGSNQRGYDQKRYDGRGHDRQGSCQRGYDQKGYDGRSYDRQDGNSDQKSRHNQGQQYNRSSGSSVQKRYPDYASSPPCDICGKLHPG
ncbi:hypothetical protein Tco_0382847 [Tanacetum coccineum]